MSDDIEFVPVEGVSPVVYICSLCGAQVPRALGPMPAGVATPDRLHSDWHGSLNVQVTLRTTEPE